MLTASKKLGIRSFFWNKEDPVHFSRFIETARLFDYVFTSDAEIVHKYKEQLGHDHVYALPFAAQHKIHNPVRIGNRIKNVSFAGTYYNFSFAERKIDMDILLKPSLDYGLEIFDRNYGVTGLAAEQFSFPAIYKKAVRGKLDYNEMLNAYREFKVALNVNSVKYSSTMFARRVFELLACGTPVISNYAKGIISLLGEGTVFIAESEADTRNYLDKLLGDPHFWWKSSLHGMRTVVENHTYSDRTREIFQITGHPFKSPPKPSFLIVSVVDNASDVHYIRELAERQHYTPSGILFLNSGKESDENLKQALEVHQGGLKCLLLLLSEGKIFDRMTREFDFSHVAFLSPKGYYGKNYLRDFSLAIGYCGAEMMGKANGLHMNDQMEIVLIPTGEFRFTNLVLSDTLVIGKRLLDSIDLISHYQTKEFRMPEKVLYSLDPFNFISDGRHHYEAAKERLEAIVDL
jgi:hypothetical protein